MSDPQPEYTTADGLRLHMEAYGHLMAFCAAMKHIPPGKQHGGMRAIAEEVRRNQANYEGYAQRLRNRLPDAPAAAPMTT